jgi:hypothetical protein
MDAVAAVVVADVGVNGYLLLHQHDHGNGACNNDDAFANDDAGVVVKVE